MTATVHYLHSQPEPIGQFVRIGNSGHRHLETLHCADRLRVEHVVVDAHGLTFRSIRSKRCARLGCGLFSIPTWRNSAHSVGTKVPDSAYRGPTPHVRYHLRISSRRVTGGLLRRSLASPLSARCTPFWHLAISSRASSTVGSKLDVMLCEALDAEGGEHIVIDYPLITTYSALRDWRSGARSSPTCESFRSIISGSAFPALGPTLRPRACAAISLRFPIFTDWPGRSSLTASVVWLVSRLPHSEQAQLLPMELRRKNGSLLERTTSRGRRRPNRPSLHPWPRQDDQGAGGEGSVRSARGSAPPFVPRP